MKQIRFVIILLSLLLVNARAARLVRFDVINKSGMPVAISLRGKETEQFYYLRTPSGNRMEPAEMSFTVATDYYTTQVFYLQPEEGTNGLRCKQPKATLLNMTHNVRLVVLECIREPIYTGEPFMLKAPIRTYPYPE